MNRIVQIFSIVLALTAMARPASGHPHIIDLNTETEIDFDQLIDELAEAQLIFVGEMHDHPGHHDMQLAIIQVLEERKPLLAIGLEMFMKEDQPILDQWVAGEISEEEFAPIFEANWQSWPLYKPIFDYARQEDIPMVGLNISREISRQVAKGGFESLTPEQREDLGGITCDVDPSYEEFIRRALGLHAHGNSSFANFCQAQLLWDKAMAQNLLEFLHKSPRYTVVILAGSGHSWKYGIPQQVSRSFPGAYRVVLPEDAGQVSRGNAAAEDADYLWLDFGPPGWTLP